MPYEPIFSDQRLDLGVDPQWDPKTSDEPVRVVELSKHDSESLTKVRVRPFLDVRWDGQGSGGGVSITSGAMLTNPLHEGGTLDVDLSLTGPLATTLEWRMVNKLVQVLRRARDADNGKPE